LNTKEKVDRWLKIKDIMLLFKKLGFSDLSNVLDNNQQHEKMLNFISYHPVNELQISSGSLNETIPDSVLILYSWW